MIDQILIYFFVLFTVTSALMVFFRGSCFYCHALELLKKAGVKKKDPLFWRHSHTIGSEESEGIEVYLPVELFTFTDAIEFITKKNKWLGRLLSCHYCLSWHLTAWSALVYCLLAHFVWGSHVSIVFFVFCIISVPYISNYLLSKLDD